MERHEGNGGVEGSALERAVMRRGLEREGRTEWRRTVCRFM